MSYQGSQENTEYIGGLTEKMTNSTGTAYRYYVPAGNSFIIHNRWANDTNAIDYATRDNIDSTAVITDKNGALLVAAKFAALGMTDNTPAQQATIASITRRKFTGQEGLDSVYLVNMNGRIYDSSGSRFFSPDPRIPNPLNTLDYDRYAYASDNPLTYNDPTGFDAQCGSGGSKCDQNKGDIQDGTPAGPTPPPTVPWPGPPVKVPGFYPLNPTSLMEIYVPGFSGMFASPFGGALGSGSLAGQRQTDSCSTPGVYVCQQQTKPPAQQPAKPPQTCPNGQSPSRANNPTTGTHMTTGLGVGGIGGLVVGGLVVANIIGFPEVEGGEALVLGLLGGAGGDVGNRRDCRRVMGWRYRNDSRTCGNTTHMRWGVRSREHFPVG